MTQDDLRKMREDSLILSRAIILVETSAWIETMRPKGDLRTREMAAFGRTGGLV